MAIDPTGFPLDLTGSNPRNKVVNDTRTLTTNTDAVFVPDGGPFYSRTLVITSGTQVLKPNVDYKCLHLLKDASLASGLDVCGIVMITNEQVTEVNLTYQVIGGEYANTVPIIRQLLENADNLEPSVNWNTHIYGKPEVYPPAPHYVSGDEFSDWSNVVMGLQSIERAILLKDVAAWESMYQYLDNLIGLRINGLDLTQFIKVSTLNIEVGKLAPKTTVYTKVESDAKYYNKAEVDAKLGDIDGNEAYYTEKEINAKFIETLVADSKYATKAELNRIDSVKADASTVYTRAQTDEKYIEKAKTYNRDYIDANLALKTASYTKPESDARFAFKADSYNKVESDQRYALRSQIPSAPDLSKFITRDEVDNAYLKLTTADATFLRKTTADSIYAKITDLALIAQVDAKFANYYTKQQADERYFDKPTVNNTFITKADASNIYLTKQNAASTYSTKSELKSASDTLVNLINTKSDTTYVNNTFATKSEVADNYYTRVVSDDRYYTKAGANAYFVDLTKFNATVSTLALKSELTTAVNTINTTFNNYALSGWVTGNFYTKSDADNKYTTWASFNSNKTTTDGLIAARATIEYVNNTFAPYTFVVNQYYNRTDSDARYTQQAYLAANYKSNGQLNELLANYTTLTYTQNAVNAINNELSNVYRKADVYTKGESGNLFLTKQPDSISTYGGGDITLIKASNSSQYSPAMYYKRESQFLAGMFATFDTSVNRWSMAIQVGQGNSIGDTNTGLNTTMVISPVHIWTQAYGNLNDYFAPRSQVYSKDAVYTKSEVQSIFLTTTTAASTYTPLTTYNAGFKELTDKIGTKADTSWVNNTFYTRTTIDAYFHNKDYINSKYYTKDDVNNTFATKSQLTAAVDKRVTWDEYNNNKNQVNAAIGNVYTKTQSDARYVSVEDIGIRATWDWVTANHFNKTEADARYYSKGDVNTYFLTKAVWEANYANIDARLKVVEARSEVYKVGDLFITTTNFASSAAVAQSIGYGTWARYAQGRTIVGFSSNGMVDEYNPGVLSNPDWLAAYKNETSVMGAKFGAHSRIMLEAEMPWHKHSQNDVFNRFMGKYSDFTNAGWNTSALDNGANTAEKYGDGGYSGDEAVVTADETNTWPRMTEQPRGGSQAMPMQQPSIVVGVWKRVG